MYFQDLLFEGGKILLNILSGGNKKILMSLVPLLTITIFLSTWSIASDRENTLEWRLPAETEYFLIQEEFRIKKKKMVARTSNNLTEKKGALQKEENRLLKHVMDRHGFEEIEFWSYSSKPGDEKLKAEIRKKYPDLNQKFEIQKLKSRYESQKQALLILEKLKKDKRETVEALEKQVEQQKYFQELSKKHLNKIEKIDVKEIPFEDLRLDLSRLEKQWEKLQIEETKKKFPFPNEEKKVFPKLQMKWWNFKNLFIQDLLEMSTASSKYPRQRWDRVQEYRNDLHVLFLSHRVQVSHFDEFSKRHLHSLSQYVKEHPEYLKNWHSLNDSFKKELPDFSLEKSTGMGMIVGNVIQCGVQAVRCRGEEKAKGISLSGFPITLHTEGDDPRNPKGFFFESKSNEQGQFLIPAVPPGDYVLYANQVLPKEKIEYRGNGRKFFVGGNHEVLILDMLVQKVPLTFRPVE